MKRLIQAQLRAVPSDPQELQQALQDYTGLVELYPDNEDYLHQYAKLLIASKQPSTALKILQHLHQILLQQSSHKAARLANMYPQLGHIEAPEEEQEEDGTHDAIYQSLHDAFGTLWILLHQKKLKEGQHLYQQGEPGHSITLILKGEVAVYVKDKNNKHIILNLIKERNFVGEGCFLTPGLRSTYIVANQDCTIVELPRQTLLSWLIKHPDIATLLEKRSNYRLMLRNLSDNSILKSIPMNMRKHLAKQAEILCYAPQSLIYKAGERLEHVDLFITGEAAYMRQTSSGEMKQLGLLPNHELVGDTAILRKVTSPADLIAITPVSLARISMHDFEKVVAGYPPLKEDLLRHADEQLKYIMSMATNTQG